MYVGRKRRLFCGGNQGLVAERCSASGRFEAQNKKTLPVRPGVIEAHCLATAVLPPLRLFGLGRAATGGADSALRLEASPAALARSAGSGAPGTARTGLAGSAGGLAVATAPSSICSSCLSSSRAAASPAALAAARRSRSRCAMAARANCASVCPIAFLVAAKVEGFPEFRIIQAPPGHGSHRAFQLGGDLGQRGTLFGKGGGRFGAVCRWSAAFFRGRQKSIDITVRFRRLCWRVRWRWLRGRHVFDITISFRRHHHPCLHAATARAFRPTIVASSWFGRRGFATGAFVSAALASITSTRRSSSVGIVRRRWGGVGGIPNRGQGLIQLARLLEKIIYLKHP